MKKIEKDIETSERAKREGLRRLPYGSFKARHPDYDSEKEERSPSISPNQAEDEDSIALTERDHLA